MVKDVSSHNAAVFFDQQIPASEGSPQKLEIQHHRRRKTLTPIEAHQFIGSASLHWHLKLLNGNTGQ